MNKIERGTGRTLLLIHGLGGSWRSWSTILDSLSAARKVIAVDLPGHGASPAESDSGTFDGLVGSVERYITGAGLTGVDVVGSSMGARIVLELARRGVVGNVVALDPGGFWRGWERTFFRITIGASGRLLGAIRAGLPALSRNAASRTALLAQLSARPWALDAQVVATELEGLSTTPTFDALVHSLASGPEQTGPAAGAGRVVIGWGRHDRLCLPETGRARASSLSHRRPPLVRGQRPLSDVGRAGGDGRGHPRRDPVKICLAKAVRLAGSLDLPAVVQMLFNGPQLRPPVNVAWPRVTSQPRRLG